MNVAALDWSWLAGGDTARDTTIERANDLTPEGVAFYKDSVELFRGLSIELDIARTSLARISGDVVRAHRGASPVFRLLADSANGAYLLERFLDAGEEFGGWLVGFAQLAGANGWS